MDIAATPSKKFVLQRKKTPRIRKKTTQKHLPFLLGVYKSQVHGQIPKNSGFFTASLLSTYFLCLKYLNKTTSVCCRWICRHNPEASSLHHALENFRLSCAGYTVAMFVLGIGDRYSS